VVVEDVYRKEDDEQAHQDNERDEEVGVIHIVARIRSRLLDGRVSVLVSSTPPYIIFLLAKDRATRCSKRPVIIQQTHTSVGYPRSKCCACDAG
jgi:hypothetical protein